MGGQLGYPAAKRSITLGQADKDRSVGVGTAAFNTGKAGGKGLGVGHGLICFMSAQPQTFGFDAGPRVFQGRVDLFGAPGDAMAHDPEQRGQNQQGGEGAQIKAGQARRCRGGKVGAGGRGDVAGGDPRSDSGVATQWS